jgi:hypothetical protein
MLGVIGAAAAATGCKDIPFAADTSTRFLINAPDTGTADRTSLTPIAVALDPLLPRAQQQVVLTTTAGSFAGVAAGSPVTALADSLDSARVYLVAPSDTALALITAQSAGVSRTKIIRFRRARPDVVQVTTDSFATDSGFAKAVVVTVLLRRTVGVPSPNLQVHLSATQGIGTTPIGQFSAADVASDAQGGATARFIVGSSNYHGPVTLTATTSAQTGAAISGSTVIQVR